MRTDLSTVVMLLAAIFVSASPAPAQTTIDDDAPRRLRVATKLAEPFVGEVDGALQGLSIDLWRRIATDLHFEYDFEVTTLDALLDGVAEGRYDAGIAAISVTPEREARMDMTHGYFTDALGIAVPAGGGQPQWLRGFANIFTWGFASAVGALVLVLMIVGMLVWLAERRHNTEQFDDGAARGIADGFWFAAVTMTTVGYGDKAPRTVPGRLLAIVWMFIAIIVISAFTGAIASSLTTAQISGAVRGPEDLRSARVGAPGGSATMDVLRDRGVSARSFDSVASGLTALRDGTIDAFVHDRSILQYRIGRNHAGALRLLEAQFETTSYAIALPPDSPLRERVNRELLRVTRDPAWHDMVSVYLKTGN